MNKLAAETYLINRGAKLTREFGLSHNQKIFKLGGRYYSWDIDSITGDILKYLRRLVENSKE